MDKKELRIELERVAVSPTQLVEAPLPAKIAFDFPTTLLNIVSSANGPIQWSKRRDDVIDINLSGLLLFLSTTTDPNFYQMSVFDFLRQLKYYGFQHLASTTTSCARYKHDHFRRGHPELLPLIQFNVMTSPGVERALLNAKDTAKLLKEHRQMTDKCRMRPTPSKEALSNDEKWMITMKMVQLERETHQERPIIPLEYFKNTAESQSNLMQNDYAGFYGNVTDDAVQAFFGTLLPVYSTEPPTDMVDGQSRSIDIGTLSASASISVQSDKNDANEPGPVEQTPAMEWLINVQANQQIKEEQMTFNDYNGQHDERDGNDMAFLIPIKEEVPDILPDMPLLDGDLGL